jgi:hypothetical protein
MQMISCFVHLVEYNTMENRIQNGYHMNEIDNFNIFILCSGDVAADVNHLNVKRIH